LPHGKLPSRQDRRRRIGQRLCYRAAPLRHPRLPASKDKRNANELPGIPLIFNGLISGTAQALPGAPFNSSDYTVLPSPQPAGFCADVLQVGVHQNAAMAGQQHARIGLRDVEAKIPQRDEGGVMYYRVRIGPFSKFGDMNTTRRRLAEAGVDTAVIRVIKQ
jgi:hypothetical protein